MPSGENEPCGAKDTIWWSVVPGCSTCRLTNEGRNPVEIPIQLPRRPFQQQGMPVAVDPDLVARGGDLSDQRRAAFQLLTDEEERRVRTGAF